MTGAINLQSPLQARRWLALLRAHPRWGFCLTPSLEVPRRRLGFSFQSNHFGLHGPSDPLAGNVIFGTSFAMGLAVDTGSNWFELLGLDKGWINLGLPVGVAQWQKMLPDCHRGPLGTALLVYHPNLWPHCHIYRRWADSGLDVFTALGWRTSFLACLRLSVRTARRRRAKIRSGRWLVFGVDGIKYNIDCEYSFFDTMKQADLLRDNLRLLANLLSGFRRIVVVRATIKQELVPIDLATPTLQSTVTNYNHLWDLTVSALKVLPAAEFHWPRVFALDDFHPNDTHWNEKGNRRFAEWLVESGSLTSN